MIKEVQPAVKSYFFEKGYKDVWNTIKGAWKRNFQSIEKYKNNIKVARGQSKAKLIYKLVLNFSAMIAVLIFGSIITLTISIINLVILLAFMMLVYIGLSIIWVADRTYLMKNKIFTACHECKEKSLIPTYICPSCGAKHSNLTPGVYGILKRTCKGTDSDSFCGEKLPTTFFNGRKNLEAVCTSCDNPLTDHETVPICIPIVGGRSVGKTAFITAFSRDFIEEVAPSKGWETEIYNNAKSDIYNEIIRDYSTGTTRMTERHKDINKTSSVSFSFFIKGKEFNPERLVHVYDIAGEVFTDNSENEIQKQYEYCQGIVLIIDPFSIPSLRYRLESKLEPNDIGGISKTDIGVIVDSFLNKLREVTGLSDKKMSNVPLAVVITKIDSAGLMDEIGDTAIKRLMSQKPDVFTNYQDAQEYLCRQFLKENNMENFLNNIDLKFKNNRFFACSAIGHTRDKGRYNPTGVMQPMEWLFRNADIKMERTWNDTKFSKKKVKID